MNNPVGFDSGLLKRELSFYKNDMIKKTNELANLKIKYNKLYRENIFNKNLISAILDINLGEYVTKDKVYDKIENCKLNLKNRRKLEEAYDILILKFDVEDKKSIMEEQSELIKELIKNSKAKELYSLEEELYKKYEKERELTYKVNRLINRHEQAEKEIKDKNIILGKLKHNTKILTKARDERTEGVGKKMEQKNKLMKEVKIIEDKMKKKKKFIRDKYVENNDCDKRIEEKGVLLNKMNEYKSQRGDLSKLIDKKKKEKIDIDKIIKEQDSRLKELNKENDILEQKVSQINNERQKLIIKGREPKNDGEKIANLDKELKQLKKDLEESTIYYKDKIQKLRNKLEINENKCKKNSEIININNNFKNDCDDKIQNITKKIGEITKNMQEIEKKEKYSKKDLELIIKQKEFLIKDIESQEKENNEIKSVGEQSREISKTWTILASACQNA